MEGLQSELSTLAVAKTKASIRIQTLGNFQVWVEGQAVGSKDWGREKTIQLFQFLVTARHRRAMHKEQITDRIWEEGDTKSNEQNFKVALHGINKVLEPNRKSRTAARFIQRQGHTYQLHTQDIWIDIDALEQYIAIGNRATINDPAIAQEAYRQALDLYHGVYLPNRLYEDWSSGERERVQVLTLGAFISLAELSLAESPMESVRLAQQALLIDPTWEDAYRIQMQAYRQKGNRPMAIKTYQQCEKILDEEFGINPLPETRKLYEEILKL